MQQSPYENPDIDQLVARGRGDRPPATASPKGAPRPLVTLGVIWTIVGAALAARPRNRIGEPLGV